MFSNDVVGIMVGRNLQERGTGGEAGWRRVSGVLSAESASLERNSLRIEAGDEQKDCRVCSGIENGEGQEKKNLEGEES